MSKEPTWACVNVPETSAEFDPSAFCAPSVSADPSPIDDFYEYIRETVTLGSPDLLRDKPTLGRLLILGVVSGVELYFRTVLSRLIAVCPCARDVARKQVVSLYAIEYYGVRDIGFGLLEGISFADSDEVMKQTKRLTGIDVPKGSSTYSSIVEYGRLCQLRHAAIHARGHLGARNLQELCLGNRDSRVALKVSFSEFQEAAVICHNCVRAYNRWLFRAVLERWLGAKLLTGIWGEDKERFLALFDLFCSKEDGVSARTAYLQHNRMRETIRRSLAG